MASRVLVSLRVAAQPDRAFEVFTTEIGVWWQHNPLFRTSAHGPGKIAMETAPGGRLTETAPDGHVFEIGRITVWEPGNKLAFSWRHDNFPPDQATHVEVTFEPVGDETRITVEHVGWDSIPIDHAARHSFPDAVFLKHLGGWWRSLLEGLRATID